MLPFEKFGLNKKIRLGLGFSIVLLILSSSLSFYTILKLIEQSSWVDHTNEVLFNIESTISQLRAAETGQRGYLLTEDEQFLEPYRNAESKVKVNLAKLKELTADNEYQRRSIDTLERLLDQRFDRLAEVLEKFRKDKTQISYSDMVVGKKLMDEIRTMYTNMRNEEQRLLKTRIAAVNKYYRLSPIVIIVSSLIAIVLAGVSFYFINRDIKNREIVQEELKALNSRLEDSNEELIKNRNEVYNQNYLLEANSRINDLLRGERDLDVLSKKVLTFLTEFMRAQSGVIYLAQEDGSFHLADTYALEKSMDVPKKFYPGEGLLGQCVLQKKVQLINDVSVKNIKINTGLAVFEVAEILIVPFYHSEKTVAIVELLSKEKFSELDLQFIYKIGSTISIFINGVRSEMRTFELLSETQNQAEELETQQEELRTMNDELREQRDKLQASDEELRASEEELQEKNAELELQYEAINSKNKALEDARQALQLKMNQVEVISKYKSDFLANMSHELRTPLNSILILSGLLKDNKNKSLSSKEVEQAGIIERSGNDLLKLINQILDLAKVESGKVKLELGDFRPYEFKMDDQFRELAREKNVNFKSSIEKGLPDFIYTDKFRVEQVLKNLLSNAFKFTPDNGIVEYVIKPVTESNKKFLNPDLNTKKMVAFVVKDTGIGIPPDKLDLIFEAFQQADPSTTRKYGGSGLGLTISRDIAVLLGGEIQVESTVGNGSKFTLYLPERADETNLEEAVLAPEKYAPVSKVLPVSKNIPTGNSSKSILIVEDDIYFSKILEDYAKSKGYDVTVTHNGNEVIALAQDNNFAAILLDVQLPDTNGWDVLKRLKHNPLLKNIPVHMMSAYDKEAYHNQMGQENFIPKPIALESLDKAFNKISVSIDRDIMKVLIVEDNENESLAVKDLLKSQGIESDNAFNGAEALDLLKKERYDGIILDIKLPDYNGYDLLEFIKKDKDLKGMPVIIYSGKDLSIDEEAKFKRYADTIIIKTEYSYTRLLEEVKLFMHNMGASIEKSSRSSIIQRDMLLKDKKVLIADDDMRNIYSLTNVLEDQGMHVVVAYDGRQAIDELDANPDTDIILMDIMMPEMDGIDATKSIRSKPEYRNLPIIAITAKAMTGDKEKCIAAGVSDYISKPIELPKLLSLMRVWLYKS
ncbi:MAG: response regulator [Sporocytophaga sp.]|uniref:response regulator n=1 Tax=Sporocytophaga sp. TaxID=2231183 RepID=UPI001B147513|nr:response regulator [Sporocytophaga sp.]MBO9699308.1 response regulator [Sporocytophaga sp.]